VVLVEEAVVLMGEEGGLVPVVAFMLQPRLITTWAATGVDGYDPNHKKKVTTPETVETCKKKNYRR
jgi:hypothetical protein